jgi:hypothetical protein
VQFGRLYTLYIQWTTIVTIAAHNKKQRGQAGHQPKEEQQRVVVSSRIFGENNSWVVDKQ